jgi:hypothetical protein
MKGHLEIGTVFTTNVINKQKCIPGFDFKPEILIFAKMFGNILPYIFPSSVVRKLLSFLHVFII